MSIPADSATLRDIETLAVAQRILGEAADRLSDLSFSAARLVGQTAWHTEAAAIFHVTASAWHREIAAVADVVEAAGDEVARARSRLAATGTASW